MSFKKRLFSALGILAIVTATAAVGLRVTRHAALAETPAVIAPPGCPAAPALKTGLLAQSSDLKFPSSSGLPPNSIELSSFQWGVGRGISSPTGASADRKAGAPSVSEVTMRKSLDKTTPLLYNETVQGDPAGWTLWDYNAKGSNGAACMKYTLSNTLVSSLKEDVTDRPVIQQGFQISTGGDQPQESVTLNFTKITMTYGPNGSPSASPDIVSTQGEITFRKIEL